MSRCSPATAAYHQRLCADVLAHGPTPELRTQAEMHCLAPHTPRQPSLVFPVPPNAGLITGGQLEPSELADHGYPGA